MSKYGRESKPKLRSRYGGRSPDKFVANSKAIRRARGRNGDAQER